MAQSVLQWLRIPFLVSSAVAAVGSSLLYFKQNELIYPRAIPPGSRTEGGSPSPEQFHISNYESLRIRTSDGETLAAFFLRATVPQKTPAFNATVIMFHGNAGNINHRLPIAKALTTFIGLNVLMLEYRGYGMSTGTPDEKGLNVDAQAGLDWIRNNPETRDRPILVYGQSLGGAVAIKLVAENQKVGDIKGLILENTFLSIRKMIPSAFPPARYLAPLCHQIWASEEVIPQITGMPVLFLSGLKDEIVPPAHMKQLYSLCRSEPKIWKELPNGDHNNSVGEPGYFKNIAEFVFDEVRK